MNERQGAFFEALTAKRTEDANALEGFALRGVKNSVVEKYSDQAHFVYELLQNADDAQATSARFVLNKEQLIFAHNGRRHFFLSNPATEEQDHERGILGDINAITAVGGSNKADGSTIGKFGVGFKAVFQYTTTPHVYDPNISFKIERFIVPSCLSNDYADRKKDETLFVFPFDHDKRIPEDAYLDISEKLRSLDYPLLFLSSLKDISFEISGILGLYGKTVEESHTFGDVSAEFVRLTQNDGDNPEDLYDNTLWLFSRKDRAGHSYSVGFFVNADGLLVPKVHSAFCFFPTKETTGLNFLIHAPFLLTDSREGIRASVQHNTDLISLLADLAADSLVLLKEISQFKKAFFIDDNIINIIPYDESSFSDVNSIKTISFKPFFTAIREKFKSATIIPCADGYVASENAYWASVPQIAELFSNEQLGTITKNKSAHWVFTSFGRKDMRWRKESLTEYIDSITRVWLNESDILTGWTARNKEYYEGITSKFIEGQAIEWLHRFYKWIAETKGRTELILSKPIFLDQDGRAVAALDYMNQVILFLPTEGGSGYNTVNDALLQNEETLTFIKSLGVTEPSLQDEIYNIILPQYEKEIAIDPRPHFKKFFLHYQKCSQTEAKTLIALVRKCNFLLYFSNLDENQFGGNARELYFPSKTLQKWFQPKPDTKFIALDQYLELVGEDKGAELVAFLSDLGIKDSPRVLSHELDWGEAHSMDIAWPNSSRKGRWIEKHFDGSEELIDAIINTKDNELSTILWSQLVKFVWLGSISTNNWSHDNVLSGTYEYFFYSPHTFFFESSEARRLRTQPWLMNRAGEFVSAEELTTQSISSQYELSSDAAVDLLRLLGIEREAEDIGIYAQSLGLTEEEQRQALLDFAKRKTKVDNHDASTGADSQADESMDNDADAEESSNKDSVKRVANDISKRATSTEKVHSQPHNENSDEPPADEDDYSKPTVDIGNRIEKIKEQAEQEIKDIARLEDLKQMAAVADKYSCAWFRALLELESLTSGQSNMHSREVSISFAKVELEAGTSRTLILKHPNRYIPQSMEELADIPLELHFAEQPMVKVAVEVVNVKSYTLRTKLRTNAQIDNIDLSLVTEARIVAKNPVFLIEELRQAFERLVDERGYEDDFDFQAELCENIEFVFGPPGTGKTTYLGREVIIPIMRDSADFRVLVLTPTNKAADVLVCRLMESMGEDHSFLNWLVRFGSTNDGIIEQSGVFREKTFDIRTFPRNVTVTTIARFPYDYFLPDAHTRLHLSALHWDYIIIDEASMIPLANIVYPLYKKIPLKFIIAGDPFQIEPITAVEGWKSENIYSMVELNSFVEPITVPHQYHVELLTTQYRSIPDIGEVFSRFAYGGVLKHFRKSGSQRSIPIRDFVEMKPINIIKFPVSKFESIYRPKRLQGKTPYQIYSALFSFEFVKYISSLIELVKGDENFRIGLIAPYRAQADLIDKLMSSAILPKNVDVHVGTIHGFQGDECDIIVALFNPPPTISTHKDMFLNKLNIINVSISRAKDYLFLLMPDDDTENIGNLELVKRVEQLCKEQPDWSERRTHDIESSIFGSSTYLEDNSFSTSHQLVNVYGRPEKRYEIRSEESAVDVQIHE